MYIRSIGYRSKRISPPKTDSSPVKDSPTPYILSSRSKVNQAGNMMTDKVLFTNPRQPPANIPVISV